MSNEEEKPKSGPQEDHLAGPVPAPKALARECGPETGSVERVRLEAPAPGAAPRKAPSISRDLQAGDARALVGGGEARSPAAPAQALLRWAPGTIRLVGTAGTVGARQQLGCP